MSLRALVPLLLFAVAPLRAQDNYEIQVYGADTVPKSFTMVELHSNFTPSGLPLDEHAFHETLEITRGFSDWFETGLYLFNAARSGEGWQYVGSHIRPRVRVPAEWHWPVGMSLSTEFGWVRSRFSDDSWSWEIRPIVDKEIGRWYLSINPALEKSVRGANAGRGWQFAPAVKVNAEVTPKIAAGFEYYASVGPFAGFDPIALQQHQIFPTIDLNVSPDWEFNAGVGWGLTKSTDRLIVKMIVGRRLRWP